jgi:hypothetical protein
MKTHSRHVQSTKLAIVGYSNLKIRRKWEAGGYTKEQEVVGSNVVNGNSGDKRMKSRVFPAIQNENQSR